MERLCSDTFPRDRRPGDQSYGMLAVHMDMGVRFTSVDGTFIVACVPAGNVQRITVLVDGHGEAVADRVTAVPVNNLGTAKPVTLRLGP